MPDPQDRLQTYRAKRDFRVTAEPAGAAAPPPAPGPGGRRFVVQRHRARRLHYDFRLEVEGVLVSWAVPKGPTLDPKGRQLAVHVEDHPIEYFDFEGVIPKGEYGGGDVIVWDWGTWEPARDGDPRAAVERGELHFDLRGEKLGGRFVLVRRDRGPDGSGKEQWLLLHKHDEFAQPGWDPEDHPCSVKSGRTNDEVAAEPKAMWRSGKPTGEAYVPLAWDPPTGEELAALDGLGARGGAWVVQGRELKLTNLDKALFPRRDPDGAGPFTKRDLIRYHARVAPFMLPYLVDRPVNLNRYPDGVAKPGFWHKEVPDWAPDWIKTWRHDGSEPGAGTRYFVVDSVPALIWMANYGAVELHAWTSKVADVHQPTWAYVDIDPGGRSTFDDVLVLARLYRAALAHLHLDGIPKVTGQRGLQIWVPIAPGYSFSQTRAWVEKVSRAVGNTVPDLVSWEWHKDRRHGLARLDYTQNAVNRTLVTPFSARAAPGAPVSMTITWDELDDPGLRPDRWTIATALDRLRRAGDPLAPLIGQPQRLSPL